MAVYKETHTIEAQPAESIATREDERPSNIAARFISLLGGILIALLAIRFILSLLGANTTNAFANFIYSASHPFVSPFFGLFNYSERFGVSRFEYEILVAIIVYAVITFILVKLVTIRHK